MNDTPDHIYEKQLQMWLQKTPAERLRQAILDNEQLYDFWRNAKPSTKNNPKTIITKEMIENDRRNSDV